MSLAVDKQVIAHHSRKRYSATEMNELLTHAKIWIDLKSILLHKRSQTQKAVCCMGEFMQRYGRGKAMRWKTDQWLPSVEGRAKN